MFAGYVNVALLLGPSPLTTKVMSSGSGGGIGIDGVMQPAKPATTKQSKTRRMWTRAGKSKQRSSHHDEDSRTYIAVAPTLLAGRNGSGDPAVIPPVSLRSGRALHGGRQHHRDPDPEEQ